MRESNPHGYDAITLFRSDKHAYATLRVDARVGFGPTTSLLQRDQITTPASGIV